MTDMTFNPENMKRRFHALGAQRKAKLSVSGPLREQRDGLIAAHEKVIAALNVQIKEAEAGLHEIDMERGALARALNGQTGTGPA
jgi:hypothetical protein